MAGLVVVALRATRERQLLALLAIHHDSVVTVERLVDEIWDGAPTDTAVARPNLGLARVDENTKGPGDLPVPPSKILLLRPAVNFLEGHRYIVALRNRHAVGVDRLMWSTDYPHHGNDWPYSRKTIDEMMFGIPEDVLPTVVPSAS